MINTPEKHKQLRLDQIEIDPEVQPRVDRDDDVIVDYAEAMRGGAKFPELVVFESDSHYLLADGHYRLAAMHRLEPKPETVRCRVLKGDKRIAMLWAAGANAEHGAQRTNKDKRKSVVRLLQDEEWRGWSDRQIAKCCHVSHTFVAEIRNELATDASSRVPEKRKGADGKNRKPPRKKVKRMQKPKAIEIGETDHPAKCYSADSDHHPSNDCDCRKSADSTARTDDQQPGSKVQLTKELRAAITPITDHWPRAEVVRELRVIADNLEAAIIKHEAMSA